MTDSAWPAPVPEILAFWFGDDPAAPLANSAKWFGGGAEFDREIHQRWGGHVEKAAAEDYDGWKVHPRPALAYLLLMDQFPRNIHRDSARALLASNQRSKPARAAWSHKPSCLVLTAGRFIVATACPFSTSAGMLILQFPI